MAHLCDSLAFLLYVLLSTVVWAN